MYVRVRPPDSYANEIDHKPCLEVTSRTSLTLFSKPDPKVFTYDQVADPNTTQVQYQSYLTIRLWAQDFYEVIVDEGKAQINYHLRNREQVI